MRPRSAAVLASRILALWIGIQALTLAIGFIVILSQSGGGGGGSFWTIIGTQAIIAFLLWTQAEGIGTAIARGTGDDIPAVPHRIANTHAVAISIVGIIVSVQGITGLIGTGASATESVFRSGLSFTTGGSGSRGGAFLVDLVTLAIGLLLVFGSGAIARSLSQSYPERETPPPPSPPAT
jgi:hypothetical protein